MHWMETGRVVNTHGLGGEVKIEPWCDSPAFLMGFVQVKIGQTIYVVEQARVHGAMLLAKLEGVDTVQAAQALKNKVLYIDRTHVELPEGRHFVQDLIGLSVVDQTQGVIGTISDVLSMPAHDVYVVVGDGGQRYIPVVDEFVLGVDVAAGQVLVRLIEGM